MYNIDDIYMYVSMSIAIFICTDCLQDEQKCKV